MSFSASFKTVVFFVAIVASSFSAGAVEIRLKGQTHAPGSIVLLGDVADIVTDNEMERDALARLELFPAPSPGKSRLLRRQEIRELLNLNKVDTHNWTFCGSRLARVSRAASVVPVRPAIAPPADESESNAVCAKRALQRGETIRPTDVEMRSIDAPPRGLVAVSSLADAVGKEVHRAVLAGEPLDGRYLKRPIAVRRGDAVTVFAQAAGVSVRTTAKSLDNGSIGDVIWLENMENHQRYAARVSGVQEARVYAIGASLPPSEAKLSAGPSIHDAIRK